jgi:Ca2+-binding RTX toxin-like protein
VAGPGGGISEKAGEGIDTVNTATSYTLGANLENLTLVALLGDFNGSGNVLKNTIVGNFGANILRGFGNNDVLTGNGGTDTLYGGDGNDKLSGGDGADTLNGGAGKDIYVFDTALNTSTNVDTVVGFVAGTDKIYLNSSIFAGLNDGALPADAFHYGAAADAEDRIIYNKTTGALFFDADGNGAGGLVQFANLVSTPLITAADFVVI